MATPLVSGAAGLIWEKFPSFTHLEVKDLILSTVDPRASLAGKTTTGGRLNIHNAVSCTDGSPSLIDPISQVTALPSLWEGAPQFPPWCMIAGHRITGATVVVTPSNGDGVFNLLDDGITPDQTAGDGIYSHKWFPASAGPVTLEFVATVSGDIMGDVSGNVLTNYIFDDTATFELDRCDHWWNEPQLNR